MLLALTWIIVIILILLRFSHYDFDNDRNYFVNVFHFWRLMIKFFRASNATRIDVHHEIGEYFPRFVHFQFFKIDILAVYDPKILRKIFLSQNACERPSSHVYQQEHSLMSAKYLPWKKARKELSPAFSVNVVKTFIPIFGEETDKIIRLMNEKNLDGREFNLMEVMNQLVINAGTITIFNLHDKISLAQQMAEPVDELMGIIMKRLVTPLMHIPLFFNMTKDAKKFDEIRDFLYGITDEALKESINNRKNNKRLDENDNFERKRVKVEYLIDILASNENFSEEEIKQHIGFLLIAAVDTSITMLTATLVYLAIHQEIQEKVYDEIMTVFKDDSVELNVDNLQKLTYLKMCIDESLRLFTPVPQMPRSVVNDKLFVGITKKLKIGTQIHIFTSVLHRRKDIWGEDADEFKPERFSQENCDERDPFSYSPFGHGPRMCAGQKYAILSGKAELMKLLKTYKFHTKLTMADLKMNHMISVRFLSPPKVWIEKR